MSGYDTGREARRGMIILLYKWCLKISGFNYKFYLVRGCPWLTSRNFEQFKTPSSHFLVLRLKHYKSLTPSTVPKKYMTSFLNDPLILGQTKSDKPNDNNNLLDLFFNLL